MEFKRVVFLKKEMAKKIDCSRRDLTEAEAFAMDALTLAYMGDACWSFFVRERLIATGIHQVHILNSVSSEMVSARKQSAVIFELKELLSERELKVCKRARNTNSSVPKSATVEEYRESTAFEGLLGYLYLSKQEARLHFLMDRSLRLMAEDFNGKRI